MAAGIAFREMTKYLVTAVCTQPLHIGSALGDKEEVLIHPVDDEPFIQAASIAGVLRGYYAQNQGRKKADELFGSRRMESDEEMPESENKARTDNKAAESGKQIRAKNKAVESGSRIRISDGSFCSEGLILELRPRVSINPKTGSCEASVIKGTDIKAGHKFNMEYVGAGAKFRFEMYLFDESKRDDIEGLLAAMHREQIQIGGQKSNGCGYMKLESVKRKVFDMASTEDRRLWAIEDELKEEEYTEILSKLSSKENTDQVNAFEITVNGCTEGNLLVKSIAVPDCGADAPDCMNLRNAKKDYIIPGSSLKGAVRSQMERIAGYLDRPDIVKDTFGYTGASPKDSKAGNLTVLDTVVGDRKENDLAELSHRIHIDKFTGGVMDGGLFHEKNVSGNLEFHISIKDRNHPDRTCGLLLMALRDLAIGMMNIGSGYNVGKGIIDVRKITVKDLKNGQKAVICYKKDGETVQGITDGDKIIERCIKALQAQRKEETAV